MAMDDPYLEELQELHDRYHDTEDEEYSLEKLTKLEDGRISMTVSYDTLEVRRTYDVDYGSFYDFLLNDLNPRMIDPDEGDDI